ncbi:hypothetical protein X548_08820 [Stenotrophomonas maltophilia 5BA-I-2]|nr:hypothetical protein X548_08820 [Stenotrophomonas maltophilia 5BA-I-2]
MHEQRTLDDHLWFAKCGEVLQAIAGHGDRRL